MKGHARDLMTHGATHVTPETPLAVIAAVFGHAGLGGLPVVDAEQNVVGFVSETDAMTALLQNRSPDLPVREIMTSPAEVIDEFAPSDSVIAIMQVRGIHHLPVVRAGRLVGIISPKDVLRYFVDKVLPRIDAG